jgi:tetratricopeptide (TPR) repeat protein
LARIALARGDKDSARNRVERAVAIDEKSRSEDRSERLRTLGAVLAVEERFDESAHVLQQAVALDREGTDELATARSLSQLANTFLREKRFSDALPLVEEATAIDQSRLGATHPLLPTFLRSGLIYLETKRAGCKARGRGQPARTAVLAGVRRRLYPARTRPRCFTRARNGDPQPCLPKRNGS